MRHERQERPTANRALSNVNDDYTTSVRRTPDVLRDLDDLADHVDGAFVVVVKVTGGKYRRRCYLTAASAERAVARALERGESATIYLAELKPLYRISSIGSEESQRLEGVTL